MRLDEHGTWVDFPDTPFRHLSQKRTTGTADVMWREWKCCNAISAIIRLAQNDVQRGIARFDEIP
jgi:hypothetical protein